MFAFSQTFQGYLLQVHSTCYASFIQENDDSIVLVPLCCTRVRPSPYFHEEHVLTYNFVALLFVISTHLSPINAAVIVLRR